MRQLQKFFDWISRFEAGRSFLTFAAPTIPAILAATGGILGNAPWMWIIMSTALVFMGVTVSIYFIKVNIQSSTPEHKLRYSGTAINYDLLDNPANRQQRRAADTPKGTQIIPRHLSKIQIGIHLFNTASFPISAYLEKAETEIEGTTPPRSTYPKKPVTIMPGSNILLADEPINVNIECGRIEGKMDISIKYGKPGNEKFLLHFKGKVEAFFVKEGWMQGNYTHWDTNEADSA